MINPLGFPGSSTPSQRDPKEGLTHQQQESPGFRKNLFETVIGVEVHAQVKSVSKLFTGAPTGFGQDPNTQVTEYCLALPGVLPVLNAFALECGIRTAMALNCTNNPFMSFARNNYFYPDLP